MMDSDRHSTATASPEAFAEDRHPAVPACENDDRFVLSLDGFEGPLDLLLALAREQKVDLAKISVRALAEQYLAFLERARRMRIEIAADYLVMAAWLAYLKSRLLLPRQEEETEPDAAEMALRLKLRLQRLEAMRQAAERLFARDRVGRDVFLRARPEGLASLRRIHYEASLYDLIRAYGALAVRRRRPSLKIRPRPILAIEEAMRRLEILLGRMPDWRTLESFLPAELVSDSLTRSAMASMFAASLELARQGKAELRQREAFGPLYLRGRQSE